MSTSTNFTQVRFPFQALEKRRLGSEQETGYPNTPTIQPNVQSRAAAERTEDGRAVLQTSGNRDIDIHVGTAVDVIKIRPLPISLEAHGPEDDWTGRSDRAVRKKLQNRLNQRASRRRRGLANSSNPAQVLPGVQAARTSELHSNISMLLRSGMQYPIGDPAQGVVDQIPLRISQYRAAEDPSPHMEINLAGGTSQERMTRTYLASIIHTSNFARWIIAKKRKEQGFNFEAFIHPISTDHLLTLSLFNLVRGLTTNILSLGVDPLRMHTDLMSPFTSMQFSPSPSNQVLSLPPTLQPTLLQRTVPHHPEVDVLPFPRLRDNAILAAATYDQVELCMSVLGLDSRTSLGGDGDRITEMTSTGLLVWGEPWNPGSWEVSEEFAKRWQWLLRGCKDLLDSTNHWRRQRGELPLMFDL